jgi:HTH-type transcriptional regulator / antitoxin HigA
MERKEEGATMKERIPAEVFPPGEFIKEELEARGLTQDDLAEILGRPFRTINEVITGKRGITTETAKGLGEAFGTGAQFWMNLESAYRLSLAREGGEAVVRRAVIYEKAPIRAMVKRNWIEYSENVDTLEGRLLDFFNLRDIHDSPKFSNCVARKSTTYEEMTPIQEAWLFRAGHLAKAVLAKPFSQTKLDDCFNQLKNLLPNVEDVRRVPKILAEHGIKFLVIEPLPQSKIDGVCFWENPKTPVIVLTLRFDRIDYFWHTLIHELEHVKNGDGKENHECRIDTDLVGEIQASDGRPHYEIEADKLAVEYLVPQDALNDFIARISPLYSKTRIEAFANAIRVHPGIVVGQLQHRQEINYSQNRDMLVKIRQAIIAEALTDGWGSSLPANL